MPHGVKGAKLNERISYWLIPAEPERTLFGKIIDRLADRFDAPKFEPHVTLYSGPGIQTAHVERLLAQASAGISEVILRSSGIGYSAEFTRTLFVRYALDETAAKLSNSLKELSPDPEVYRFEPHLSLIYSHLPTDLKELLAHQTEIPPLTRFKAIQAVMTGPVTRTNRDVETWRVISHKPFAREV
jgi:hypothetical protein